MAHDYLQKTLIENWRREVLATALYEKSAALETDERRKQIFTKLADVERRHAQLWGDKLRALGVDVASLEVPKMNVDHLNARDLVTQIEAIENSNDTWYKSQRNVIDDKEIVEIIDSIEADEADHAALETVLYPSDASNALDVPVDATKTVAPKSTSKRLNRMWASERWHKNQTGGWVGDAIYGVNDGLGAIFGIIAGVAGYTANSNTILISGFFGAVASTLSMGAGAWLATKSENELMESEIAHERREIEEDPQHEIEELALIYQLKGFDEEKSLEIAAKIAEDKDEFLKTMAQEELGIHETSKGNPWKSALFGSVSTFVGAIVPLIPFFFLTGVPAIITAAIVSLIAHFAVGAAKSKITVRGWFASGIEMTFVGVLVGVISYGLGELGQVLLG